ncbi:MAG: hypothetical protein R2751_04550 [Bacteroidales bacterium]
MIPFIRAYLKGSRNLHSLGGYLASAVFGLLLFLVMVRSLSPEMYGNWVIFITVASLFDMFRLGLTGTGVIRQISITEGLQRDRFIGAGYRLGIYTTLGLGLMLLLLFLVLHSRGVVNPYMRVWAFYPLLSVLNLPYLQAINYNQGIQNFKRILAIRLLQGGLAFGLVAAALIFLEAGLTGILLMYVLAAAITSLVVMGLRWDGHRHLKHRHRESLQALLNFGKYSTLGSIGSNLLRSSDTVILSLNAAMGPEAIALFAIPLKFVELVEVPLRSFSSTALPKLSIALKSGPEAFNRELHGYISFTMLLLLPVLGGGILFSGTLLQFLGGEAYAGDLPLQKQLLFLIFVYVAVLPVDRYTGMALFALNRPDLNLKKIGIMLGANVLLDILAVFVFQSLFLVALATVLFTLLGVHMGNLYLHRMTGFRARSIPWEIVHYSLKAKERLIVLMK